MENAVTLIDGANIALDASRGTFFRVTLGGARTLSNPTNPRDGQIITIMVIQDGTGGRTLAFDTKFVLTPYSYTASSAASAYDFIRFIYSLTYDKWYFLPPQTGQANVAKTGQTTSYDNYDDGYYEKGVSVPTRFTDNGNGTITDNLTGLIWLKNFNVPAAQANWATALDYIDELNASGTMNSNSAGDTSKGGSHQTDWRLPNLREILSLLDFSQESPPLPSGHPFTNVVSDSSSYYWSSTTHKTTTTEGWYIRLYQSGGVDKGPKTATYYTCAVRGGK